MKQCPKCQSTYTDDTLGFCLQDGTSLHKLSDIMASADTLEMRNLPTHSMESGGSGFGPSSGAGGSSGYSPGSGAGYPPGSGAASGYGPGASASTPPIVTVVAPKPHRALISGVFLIALLLLGILVVVSAFLLRGILWDTDHNRRVRSANLQQNNNDAPGTGDGLKIEATASTVRVPYKGITYQPQNLLDQNLGSAWIEGVDGPGPGSWVKCDFDREIALNSITVYPGYFKDPTIWKKNNRVAKATILFSDGTSIHATFPDQMQPQDVAAGGVRTRWVKLVIDDIYSGTTDSEDTAISELKFDWKP